jgi:hypothetical protein
MNKYLYNDNNEYTIVYWCLIIFMIIALYHIIINKKNRESFHNDKNKKK